MQLLLSQEQLVSLAHRCIYQYIFNWKKKISVSHPSLSPWYFAPYFGNVSLTSAHRSPGIVMSCDSLNELHNHTPQLRSTESFLLEEWKGKRPFRWSQAHRLWDSEDAPSPGAAAWSTRERLGGKKNCNRGADWFLDIGPASHKGSGEVVRKNVGLCCQHP